MVGKSTEHVPPLAWHPLCALHALHVGVPFPEKPNAQVPHVESESELHVRPDAQSATAVHAAVVSVFVPAK